MGRRFLCRVLFLALVLSLAAGCGRTEDGAEETDGTAADTAADVNAAAGAEPVGDGTMLTTFEAASLAYETAKQWRSDAVLWWLLPVSAHLDEDWENSDTCFEWDTIFVNRSDDSVMLCISKAARHGGRRRYLLLPRDRHPRRHPGRTPPAQD
jgi:hypothetical protein